MGRTAWTVAGGIVGAYFGYPQLGMAIGGVIGGVVDPEQITGPRIGETSAQTSQEGAPRPIIYGAAPVFGNVIASGVIVHQEVETEGEKGGGPITSSDHVYRTYAIRICEGPIGGILRVWEDEKLVYDIRPGSLMLEASAAWIYGCNLYLGDETQLPDTFLQILVSGIGETPAYRGTAYMVFVGRDLTDRRGSIPQYRFEVAAADSFAESSVLLAPLIAREVWQAETFQATFAAYGETQQAAVDASGQLQEGTGELFTTLLGCYNYADPPDDSSWRCDYDYPGAADPYSSNFFVLNAPGKGLPPSPPAWVRVTGTAKQLADVEYVGLTNVVHQDGLGPVLLPGDPNYDNEEFWDAQRAAALTAGTLQADVDTPVVVAEYARAEQVVQTAQGGPVLLSGIVSDIHARCGLPAANADVSELTDLVDGLVLAGDYTGADAINTLRAPYFFDKFEADKKIWYPKRGAAVVTTLTIDDLVEEPDESNRKQAIEYPKKLHLAYQHAASGYAAVKATYARSSPDARVVGEVTTQVPVVFNEDQAAQIVHKMFKVAYAEAQGEVTLSVPESFLWITPTDNIGLSLRGAVSRLRIDKADHADGILKWTLKHDRQSAYTSNLTGIAIPAPTLPPSTLTGSTVLAVMDIGSRVDNEDDLHILYAVTGGLPGWYGAMVQRSLDGGATYANAASIGRASVMGSLVNPMPTASEFYTDTTNTVRVQLYRDTQTIEDLTEAQFLSEGGAFALEKLDGSFEVMQYRDAVDEGDGQFLLSVLHRGLLNSGPSSHPVGALFVMLDRASHLAAESAWIGQALTHRAPSFEQPAELAAEQTATYVGRSQIEWPVASFAAARDGSDVITATWAPRHRFGSDDAPVASANFQGYRVTLDDGVLAPVTFDTTPASFSYDASALGSPLTVSVSALNRITGAGPATSGSV